MPKKKGVESLAAKERMKACVDNLKKAGGKRATFNMRPAAVKAIELLKKDGYGKDATEVINRLLTEKVSG